MLGRESFSIPIAFGLPAWKSELDFSRYWYEFLYKHDLARDEVNSRNSEYSMFPLLLHPPALVRLK
jgi:hypothetical protein